MNEQEQNNLIQLAIKKGFSSASSIKDALDHIKEKRDRGETPSFFEALIDKKALTEFQLDYLLKQVKDKESFREAIQESPDSLIEGYEIISNLGMGGMGTVYKARQIAMDRLVALKVLKEELAASSRYVSRFLKEAKACGTLNHQNIVNVYEVGHASGLYYIAMEYIDGETLKDIVEKEKHLEPKVALDYALQVGRGLIHMQQAKVIHRDIKPENIMITKNKIAKLADLGIAKREEDKSATQTKKGFVVGTFEYMSPEQASAKTLDFKTDMYSLGVSLYASLDGNNPFLGSSPSETVSNVINKKTPSLRNKFPDHYQILDELIGTMTKKNRSERYESPAILVKRIESALSEMRSPRKASGATSKNPTKHYQVTIISLVVVVLILVVLLLVNL